MKVAFARSFTILVPVYMTYYISGIFPADLTSRIVQNETKLIWKKIIFEEKTQLLSIYGDNGRNIRGIYFLGNKFTSDLLIPLNVSTYTVFVTKSRGFNIVTLGFYLSK